MGLTHEEPIVDSLIGYVNSYKDLPILVYQIQTKFRNELRAKNGILRGREFLMKDMYSFSRTQEEHDEMYEKVAEAYHRIYEKLGVGSITYRTLADGGIFTKKFSDEFQTISDVGEDTIYVDEEKKIAVNKEIYNDENLLKIGLKKENLVEKKAIEVGNIFPLESKYTDALEVFYTDEAGDKKSIISGCYGIGISRIMGTIVEVFADEKGIIWPKEVSPFHIHLILLGNSDETKVFADKLYKDLKSAKVDVLYDDRDLRAGEKFADSDLIGIPLRCVVSDKTVAENKVEIKHRTKDETELVSVEDLMKNF